VLLLLTAVTLPVVVASSFLIYQYLRYSVLVERRLSGEQTAGSRALGLPLDRDDLEQRLEVALLFYLCFRPHEGLKGATPAEAFVGASATRSTGRFSNSARCWPGSGPHYGSGRLVVSAPCTSGSAVRHLVLGASDDDSKPDPQCGHCGDFARGPTLRRAADAPAGHLP
jgi:hypothetical protein